ncbi:TraM recognition domain-containing protein [Aliarcobacter butzleri]|uniref:type IV secretory system conjugative DNA transfer family protein n=1 Tax=Aliarcobacter butzleri TaxID=28197 RepID=UPI00263DEC8F|nr:TraM recognition domain-containing protein [Aliarcobacter butzleri]MDN5125877.1 TraM recognition domain-containing protein [Aliarcobacter butzleri]
MLFKKTEKETPLSQDQNALSSALGRGITSISSAKDELFHPPISFNPLDFIKDDKYFLGLERQTQQPLYNNESIHTQIVAPTRSGKGIFIAVKVIEALRKNKGVIIIDPKEDDFLAQVILEELQRQNRTQDLQIVNWSNDFGYTVFSELDSVEEATKKMIVMLNLIENDAELGASFYKKSERIILAKVMYLFFNSKTLLEVEFDLTLQDLSIFLKYIISDLISNYEFQKELEKNKPNFDKLASLSKRYFNPDLFATIEINYSNLSILESLQFSISEFENVSIYNKYHILDSLTKGKVLYIKSDMLDETALKFLKLVITDIIQFSKKYKKDTNCLAILDELSFYPTQILSAGLSTVAGFGVNFILAYQSEAQMKDENLRVSIKDNCQTKIYYKSSDDKTLKYIELLSGLELVTQKSKKGNETTIRQQQEAHMNITRLRALPRAKVAVLIEENLNEIKIFQTSPIPVKNKFNWDEINSKEIFIKKLFLLKAFKVELKQEISLDTQNQDEKELVL